MIYITVLRWSRWFGW